MKKVTIYEVAEEADVSLATVSRVINNSDLVKAETRDKVLKAIDELGYKPNAIAQGLALKKTTTIALLIPEASFTYTGQIINGLLDVAKIDEYNIYLHTITDGIVNIEEVIDTIIKSRVDGVVIYNDRLKNEDITALSKYDIPIAVIGNKLTAENVSSVYVDVEKAIYELVLDMLERDVKDIMIMEDRKNEFAVSQMIAGAKRAFKEKGLEFDNYLEIPSEYRSSYAFLSEYFKEHQPEAIIANRDSQAIACLNAAAEAGYSVPDDIEVVCVIDTKYNKMLRPQVSSFSMPSYDLGAVAMRLMTKKLNGKMGENDEQQIELSYVYTPRQSTKQ